MEIAESAAALEWKRRKLNNGTAAPLLEVKAAPAQPPVDQLDSIWAHDALTKAWHAAVLDFQEAETGLPHSVSIATKRARSAIWYGVEGTVDEATKNPLPPASASSSDVSSSSDDSSDSSDSSDSDDDAPPVVLSSKAPVVVNGIAPRAVLDSDDDDSSSDNSDDMDLELPAAPAPPKPPAAVAATPLQPPSPSYTPQSPNWRSTPARTAAPATLQLPAAGIAAPGGAAKMDGAELQSLLDSYWQAGYRLGRFHASHGLPDSLAGR